MKGLPFEFTHRWADLGPLMQRAITSDDDSQWREFVGLLEDRDKQLEDFLSRTPVIFDRDASVSAFRSKPWTAKDFGQVREWNAELGQDDLGADETQPSDVTLEFHINGVATGHDLVIPAGSAYADFDGELPQTAPGDRVTLYCEDVGFKLVSTVSF